MAIAAAIAILAGAAGAVAALGSRTASAPPAASPASSGSLPIPVREEPGLDPELAALVAAPAEARATAAHHAATSKRHPVLKARGADPLAEVIGRIPAGESPLLFYGFGAVAIFLFTVT